MTDAGKLPPDYFQRQRTDFADLCVRVLDVGCSFGGLERMLRGSGIAQ